MALTAGQEEVQSSQTGAHTRLTAADDHPAVRHFAGGSHLPPELLELRRRTFVGEKDFLTESDLTSPNDDHGVHIALFDRHTGQLMGATHILKAEESDFAQHTGVPRAWLENSTYSSRSFVNPDFRHRGCFQVLIYQALRWTRMLGRRNFLGYMEEGNPPIHKMLRNELLTNLPRRQVTANNRTYEVIPGQVDVNYAMQRAYRAMPRQMRDFVRMELMPAELVETVMQRIGNFYQGPWFRRVLDGTLTKHEYFAAVANLHQYVRWTTRLLAQITGITDEPELRKHYLRHLDGEIDHEKMLEKDLATLGYDIDYVRNQMAPDPGIYSFMAIQQNLVAFERNPVLFLIVPLVAEALSAHVSREFLDSLETCISSWGVESPRSAMTFLRSHIHTDGGEDGHWEAVRSVLEGRITDESMQQRALSIIHAIMDAQDNAYHSYVVAPDLSAFRPGTLPTTADLLDVPRVLHS